MLFSYFLTALQISVISFSIVLIFQILRRRDRHFLSSMLLAGFLSINAISLILYLFVTTGAIEQFWFLYRTTLPLSLTVPGLSYLYIRSTLRNESVLRLSNSIHLAPLLIGTIQYTPYYVSSVEFKKRKVRQLIEGNAEYTLNVGLLNEEIFSVIRILIYMVYSLLILKLLRDMQVVQTIRNLEPSGLTRNIYKWIAVFGISISINMVTLSAYIGVNLLIDNEQSLFIQLFELVIVLLFNSSLLFYTIYLLIYPETLLGILNGNTKTIHGKKIKREELNSGSNKNNGISTIESREILTAFDEAIKQDEIYLQNSLQVKDVARKLDVSARKLSFIINEHYGVNFNALINEYRIYKAIELIEDGYLESYTINALYRETGFSNKTSFYKYFKKKTGSTPTSYAK